MPAPPLFEKLQFVGENFHGLRDGIRVMGASAFFKLVSEAKYIREDASDMMKAALCSRLNPGDGDFPIAQLLRALDGAGCKPTVGLEVFALKALRRPARETAERGFAAYRQLAGSWLSG